MKKYLSFILSFIFIVNFANSQLLQVPKELNIAVLVYNGVYLLDFAGPVEVFNDATLVDKSLTFNLYTVAADNQTIKCHTGTRIIPDFTFANCPKPDILIVPGGDLELLQSNPKVRVWLSDAYNTSKYVISICTGAFIIAELGILNNLEATTWHDANDNLQKLYPFVKVVKKRFTDNGKVLTTAGVSAGIDGSLHLLQNIYGTELANKVMKYIEFNCKTD
ncbi:MAG: DJ-1/PfpI family protein [Candidatus Kapabacteria bacterium]|nr:DJ-1/PfpI family protein [Candidatus Kapabacteria bacterium]